MVFFNYATMQMAAKIVYYGPGLCGKTTNLHHIYAKTSPQSRGEMVSLETETDRTLFFDLLPIDVGVIGGFKTRLQLYTVPGQVFYNTTRKLVLKGVDGIVFVADSQRAALDANVESFKNLRENLSEIGIDANELPIVIQLNKRDLPNAVPVPELVRALDPENRFEHVESIAASGMGVFETLKLISKLTLRTLRRRMTGEDSRLAQPVSRGGSLRLRGDDTASGPNRPVIPPPPAPPQTPEVAAIARTPLGGETGAASLPATDLATEQAFDGDGTVAVAAVEPPPAALAEPETIESEIPKPEIPEPEIPEPETPEPEIREPETEPDTAEPETAAPGIETAGTAPAPVEELEAAEAASEAPWWGAPAIDDLPAEPPLEAAAEEPEPAAAPFDAPDAFLGEPLADLGPSSTEYIPEPAPVAPDLSPAFHLDDDEPEEEIPRPEPPVKTVKVRSSVDVMAELEALRKRATQAPPKAARRDVVADLSGLKQRRDLHRSIQLEVPSEVFARARELRVTLTFEDGGNIVETREQQVELGDPADLQSLSVNLKIDLA